MCRWGTAEKQRIIKRYLKNKYGKDNYKEYIGIAADEFDRIEKNLKPGKILPLVEWNMSENDCLEYCYKQGFEWKETYRLYDILDRVSCWCCSNKNKKELNNMFYYLPNYYLKIIGLLKEIIKNNDKNSVVVKKAKDFYMKML